MQTSISVGVERVLLLAASADSTLTADDDNVFEGNDENMVIRASPLTCAKLPPLPKPSF